MNKKGIQQINEQTPSRGTSRTRVSRWPAAVGEGARPQQPSDGQFKAREAGAARLWLRTARCRAALGAAKNGCEGSHLPRCGGGALPSDPASPLWDTCRRYLGTRTAATLLPTALNGKQLRKPLITGWIKWGVCTHTMERTTRTICEAHKS